jgi:hypothetical protein
MVALRIQALLRVLVVRFRTARVTTGEAASFRPSADGRSATLVLLRRRGTRPCERTNVYWHPRAPAGGRRPSWYAAIKSNLGCGTALSNSGRRVLTGRNRDDERRRFCRFLAPTAMHRYAWHLTCSRRLFITFVRPLATAAESKVTHRGAGSGRRSGPKSPNAPRQGMK